MRQIFISYSQADRQCADEVVALLEAEGLGCWIAPRDISPSTDWAAEIIDAISAARFMVLVFSASSNRSPQVRREVERAVHKGVTVLPFRIEDVMPSKSLEFFLSTQHWMDAFPAPRHAHYRILADYLRTQLGVPAPATAAVGAAPLAGRDDAGAGSGGMVLSAVYLEHIEAELASHIGPLAKLLVRREARRAAGAEELIARLSVELDTEADRSSFVHRCRQLPSVR